MKRSIIILLVLAAIGGYGQTNLILNPSFEEYTGCIKWTGAFANLDSPFAPEPGSPESTDFEGLGLDWYRLTHHYGTADLFTNDFCDDWLYADYAGDFDWEYITGVPLNARGDQEARTGVNYAGIGAGIDEYETNPSACFREYLVMKFDTPLEATDYTFTAYLSRADVHHAKAGFGIYVTDEIETVEAMYPLGEKLSLSHYGVEPTAIYNEAVVESDGWEEVVLNFTASGGENYLIFGFFDGELVEQGDFINNLAYYFIDDVSLYRSDDMPIIEPDPIVDTVFISDIDTTSTIAKIENTAPLLYAPNAFTPESGSINNVWQIYATEIDPYDFHLTIYNRWGELIWESYDPSAGWNGLYGNKLADGLFVWHIATASLLTDEKFVYTGFVTVLR